MDTDSYQKLSLELLNEAHFLLRHDVAIILDNKTSKQRNVLREKIELFLKFKLECDAKEYFMSK